MAVLIDLMLPKQVLSHICRLTVGDRAEYHDTPCCYIYKQLKLRVLPVNFIYEICKNSLIFMFECMIWNVCLKRTTLSTTFKKPKAGHWFWIFKRYIIMNNKSKGILDDLVLQLARGKFDSEIALKLEEIYGRWGMTFTFNVGIFLWPVSLVVTTIMFVVFIRKKLLGATQKFIMSILILDLCFVSTTAIRDTLLKVFDMNYGFLEYRVCPEVMYSIRLQMVLHATSAWLNTLMSVHHLLLVGFPLRVRMCNLSAYLYTFLVFHMLFCSIFLVFLITPEYEPIPLIQEYRSGYPPKKIEGCVLKTMRLFWVLPFYNWSNVIMYILILYSQVIPFSLNLVMAVGLVILLNRHLRSLTVLTDNVSINRVSYVRLMKINIGLGVSSILQEVPLIFVLFSQFHFFKWDNTNEVFSSFQGLATTIIYISSNVGKPINLLIYSSLSSSFKKELQHIMTRICCNFLCICRCVKKKSKATQPLK